MIPDHIRQMQAIARNPSEAEPIQRVAYIIAERERALVDALADLADALDAEEIAAEAVDVEERRAELLAFAEAIAPGDGDLAEWYAEHLLGRRGPLDPDDAVQVAHYVGLDAESWREQITRWANSYREGGDYADYADRQLADAHLSEAYGAPSLEWWEEHVVEMTTGDVIQQALDGHLSAVEHGIERAAEVADGR